MKKSAEKLLDLMEKDSEFTQKVLEQKSNEDVIKIADSKGIELTEEDIDIINEELKNRSEKMILDKIDEDTSAGQLLKKMFADDSFAEKILSQDEAEKVIAIAQKEGINLSLEDIEKVNETLMETSGITPADLKDGELTEEELENIAGGIDPLSITIIDPIIDPLVTRPVTVSIADTYVATEIAKAVEEHRGD